MISEKFFMGLYQNDESENFPEFWYYLNKIFWDHENNRVTVNLPLTPSIFSKIMDALFDNELSMGLWFQDQYEIGYELYNTINIPNAKITKIRILNSTWGDTPWFLPSCNIQFEYNKKEMMEENLFNGIMNRDYQYFYSNGGKIELSVISGDKIVNFENFELNICFDNSLFPFEFMCCKNSKNIDETENMHQYFIENNTGLKLHFNMNYHNKNNSISFNPCYIDKHFRNKNIPYFTKIFSNTTIYGYSDQDFKLTFNNGLLNKDGFVSLIEYINQNTISQIIMKDKNGNIALEL